jgi:hypothetical protein
MLNRWLPRFHRACPSTSLYKSVLILSNCSDPWEKDPNFECLRVLRTRKHSKFGNFLTMAEQ